MEVRTASQVLLFLQVLLGFEIITALPSQSGPSDWLARYAPAKQAKGRIDGEARDNLIGIDPDFVCPGYGVWPHPVQCELYYTCYFGEPTYLWKCSGNLLFDLVYDGCNYPEMTDCGDRVRPGSTTSTSTSTTKTTTTTTTTTPSPTAPFTCTEDGFFPIDPNTCSSSYYSCIAGVAYIQTCPGGAIFDPVRKICAPADQVTCGFVCPDQDGFYAIPGECSSSYYSCIDGVAYERLCPGGSIFDPETLVCVPPVSASCNQAYSAFKF